VGFGAKPPGIINCSMKKNQVFRINAIVIAIYLQDRKFFPENPTGGSKPPGGCANM